MSTTLPSGTLLQGGRYRIERVLGQGGFGITYLATHTGFDQKVALKEFYMKELCVRDEETSHVTLGTGESSATVERFRGKFLKEARNLFRLNHKHIVRVLDIFEENGTAYFAMEYAEGGSLSDRLKAEGALPEYVATRYILQVAEALAYLHERKMNHLDVKPANIMLSASDDAVLIDFGLAKQYDATGSQTSTTPAGISEGYAPMEQYKLGGVAEFTPETDIYALGATFFKLLTGETPPSAQDVFEDGVPVEMLRQHGVSEAVIDIILRAMNPQKKTRFDNANLFKEGLNCISASAPIRLTNVVDARVLCATLKAEIETLWSTDFKILLFKCVVRSDAEGSVLLDSNNKEAALTGYISEELIDTFTNAEEYIIDDLKVGVWSELKEDGSWTKPAPILFHKGVHYPHLPVLSEIRLTNVVDARYMCKFQDAKIEFFNSTNSNVLLFRCGIIRDAEGNVVLDKKGKVACFTGYVSVELAKKIADSDYAIDDLQCGLWSELKSDNSWSIPVPVLFSKGTRPILRNPN